MMRTRMIASTQLQTPKIGSAKSVTCPAVTCAPNTCPPLVRSLVGSSLVPSSLVHFAKDDIEGAQGDDGIGHVTADDHLAKGREVAEARRTELHSIGLVAPAGEGVHTVLALGAFVAHVALGRVDAQRFR